MPKRRASILTVLGARPQFVKAAPLSRAFRALGMREIILHTGQHYDRRMSDIFFSEMGLPQPQINLGLGGGKQGEQTAAMLRGIEKVMLREKPQLLVVVGDTNSTLAGALAAAKLQIPIAHVEAGLRSFNRAMPEEINRIVTDHLSDLLLCPGDLARRNLADEGITRGVHICGDVMLDAIRQFLPIALKRPLLRNLGLAARGYFVLTIHRPVNTDDDENLENLLRSFSRSPLPVVFPIHPRTRRKAEKFLKRGSGAIQLLQPLGYLDMLHLQKQARLIFTDSGGMQKEALYLQTPCVTLREETEWPETLNAGWNRLVGANPKKIARCFAIRTPKQRATTPYGNGRAAQRIARIIRDHLR